MDSNLEYLGDMLKGNIDVMSNKDKRIRIKGTKYVLQGTSIGELGKVRCKMNGFVVVPVIDGKVTDKEIKELDRKNVSFIDDVTMVELMNNIEEFKRGNNIPSFGKDKIKYIISSKAKEIIDI